ncbi:MAG TPA: hypothetical protein VFE30_19325 [Anaeromyxobacteraceae bacterium]|nr:hypothetical protein [Anaeromyxobacteraceae bacterium]
MPAGRRKWEEEGRDGLHEQAIAGYNGGTVQEHLYVFGYEDPIEAKSNDTHGTDFESSLCFKILAETEEEALRWGQELSESFVKKLFGDPAKSWKAERFANWIEHEPDALLQEAAQRMPPVRVGEHPDFEAIQEIWHS